MHGLRYLKGFCNKICRHFSLYLLSHSFSSIILSTASSSIHPLKEQFFSLPLTDYAWNHGTRNAAAVRATTSGLAWKQTAYTNSCVGSIPSPYCAERGRLPLYCLTSMIHPLCMHACMHGCQSRRSCYERDVNGTMSHGHTCVIVGIIHCSHPQERGHNSVTRATL